MKEMAGRASHLVLTGGEPTIRSDFPELLSASRDLGYVITLQTNGRMMSNPAVLSALEKCDNLIAVVALHAGTARVHDAITGIEGSFEQTLEGLRAVRTLGISVSLKTVLSRLNLADLEWLPRLNSMIGAASWIIAFPHIQCDNEKEFKELVPEYTEVGNVLPSIAEAADYAKLPFSFEAIPFCVAGGYLKHVGELAYRGEEYHCTQVGEPLYDWNIVRQTIKNKPMSCSGCAFDTICEGVWKEYALFYGDRGLRPWKSLEWGKKIAEVLA
jgi:MoaA/NifB/PqqE/SkfB family radical SAM enzyme